MTNVEKLSERMPTNFNAQLNAARAASTDISGIANTLKLLSELPAQWNNFGTISKPSLPGPSISGLSADQVITVLSELLKESNGGGKFKALLGLGNSANGYLAKAQAVVKALGPQGAVYAPYIQTLARVVSSLKGCDSIVNTFIGCLSADKQIFKDTYNNDINAYVNAVVKNKSLPLVNTPVVSTQTNQVQPTLPPVADALETVNNQKNIIQQGVDVLKKFFSNLGNPDKKVIKDITSSLLKGKAETVDGKSFTIPTIVKYLRANKADSTVSEETVYLRYKQRFEKWWTANANKYLMSESYVGKLSEMRTSSSGDTFKAMVLDIIKVYPDANASTVHSAIIAALDLLIADASKPEEKRKYHSNIDYTSI